MRYPTLAILSPGLSLRLVRREALWPQYQASAPNSAVGSTTVVAALRTASGGGPHTVLARWRRWEATLSRPQ